MPPTPPPPPPQNRAAAAARPAFNPSLGVALGATAISFASVFVEGIDGADVGPTGIAFHRAWIGAALLTFVALARRQRLWPSRRALGLSTLAGVLFAADLWVWHRSIRLVGGGLATVLGNTQVFWVALAGALLHRERLGRGLLFAIPAALLGIALATGIVGDAASRADPLGVLLGLATGVFYATYVLTVRRAQHLPDRLAPLAQMVWTSLSCAAAAAIFAAADGTRVLPERPSTWGLLVGLAAVGQGLGWVTLSTFVPRVPVSRAGLLLLLQPTFAVVWAALLFARTLSPWQVAGCALTLAAIYVGSLSRYAPPSAAVDGREPDPEP